MMLDTFLVGFLTVIAGILLMFLENKHGFSKLSFGRKRPDRVDIYALGLVLIVGGGIIIFFGIMQNGPVPQ